MQSTVTEQISNSGDSFLRQKFGTPDILVERTISPELARHLESFDFFFIATSNRKGDCDASFRGKGDDTSALKVLDKNTIIFPDYLGNGSFRSLGNILENPHIGMLFIDLGTGARTRVNGDAEISQNKDWLRLFPGCIQLVKVTVREVYRQNQPVAVERRD